MDKEYDFSLLPDKVVLFDGVCNLCDHAVQYIIRKDPNGALSFLSLQSALGQQVLIHYQLPTVDYDSFLYLENGVLYSKSDAALTLSKHLKGFVKHAHILKVIPRFIRDAVYNFVAKNRYRFFGKKDACMIPTPALKARFLDK